MSEGTKESVIVATLIVALVSIITIGMMWAEWCDAQIEIAKLQAAPPAQMEPLK